MKQRILFLFSASVLVLAACGFTGSLQGTPASTPTKTLIAYGETVMHRAAEGVCPEPFAPSFHSSATEISFDCVPAAGHSVTAVLHLLPSFDSAQAWFEEKGGQSGNMDFHGHPLKVTEQGWDGSSGVQKRYRIWLWQATAWVIQVTAFDDTPYQIAPDPEMVSEFIYQAGVDEWLWQ